MRSVMRSVMIGTPHQILFGSSNKVKEMRRPCSTYGGEERRIQGFGAET